MASTINDKIQLLKLRTQKAVTLINLLRKENQSLKDEKELAEQNLAKANEELDSTKQQFDDLTKEHNKLSMDYQFANNRIIELQNYVDDYKQDAKLLEESINKSIDTLNEIDGLDEIELMGNLTEDLETADSYTANDLSDEDLDELSDLEGLDDDSELSDLDELDNL